MKDKLFIFGDSKFLPLSSEQKCCSFRYDNGPATPLNPTWAVWEMEGSRKIHLERVGGRKKKEEREEETTHALLPIPNANGGSSERGERKRRKRRFIRGRKSRAFIFFSRKDFFNGFLLFHIFWVCVCGLIHALVPRDKE